jgi:hypothetical protein
MEAVRQALAALGNDATMADLQSWIREHLHIEITKKHVSANKTKILREGGQPAAAAAPHEANGTSGARPAPAKKEAGLSKMEAVRKALRKFGRKADSLKIQGYLKERFDIDMTRAAITKYKSAILQKLAAKKQAPAKEQQPAASDSQPAPKPAGAPAQGTDLSSAVQLQDVLLIKDLLGRVGAAELHTLVEAFAR